MMKDAPYYRQQAERARQLAGMMHQPDMRQTLREVARDLDDIAEDLEMGAVDIRHPELLPQNRPDPA